MKLNIYYKNSFGEIWLSGKDMPYIHLTEIYGLGQVEKEYKTVVFQGYDGQETVSERALPRVITINAEFCGKNTTSLVEEALRIFDSSGFMFVETERFSRRIFCNQVRVSELERLLKGEISNMAVQFVCDNPFFEDSEETVVPLYERAKNLKTEFTMPCMFGSILSTATIKNTGSRIIEPVIKIFCPEGYADSETITVKNNTTGKELVIEHTAQKNEIITIDIKNRTVLSSCVGNLLFQLSEDSFLGDFNFLPGKNHIGISVGNSSSGFFVDCRYVNSYCEAVVV